MTRQLYHLANIRDLLVSGFDARELRRLCQDVPDFRPVYDNLARDTSKLAIVDKLISYAERHLLLDRLLALTEDLNPARYEHHGPYYVDDPAPALTEQVSDLAEQLAAVASSTTLTPEQQYQIATNWVDLGRTDSLKGFDLHEADLRGVDLLGADLRQANLSCARLDFAILAEADLRLAELSEADLSGANLSGADLRGANLKGTTVTLMQLSETKSLKGATLPDGTKHR
jgi:hypothetical protein